MVNVCFLLCPPKKGIKNTKQTTRKNRLVIKLMMSPLWILAIVKKLAKAIKRSHPQILNLFTTSISVSDNPDSSFDLTST